MFGKIDAILYTCTYMCTYIIRQTAWIMHNNIYRNAFNFAPKIMKPNNYHYFPHKTYFNV